MEKIKIAIVDDHKIVLEGLVVLLSNSAEFEVLFTALNGATLLEKLKKSDIYPDVILMDIEMPEMDGFEATKEVLKIIPKCKILFLSSHKGIHYTIKAIQSNARGYLLKDTDSYMLYETIIKVFNDGYHFDENFSEIIFGSKETKFDFSKKEINFSSKELKLIRLLCQEKTYFEMGEQLNLSEETIKTYRKRIMKKMNVKKKNRNYSLCNKK